MRHKSHPITRRWSKYHWQRWDEETRRDRLAYEQKIEERDNAKIMAHIRGRRGGRNYTTTPPTQ